MFKTVFLPFTKANCLCLGFGFSVAEKLPTLSASNYSANACFFALVQMHSPSSPRGSATEKAIKGLGERNMCVYKYAFLPFFLVDRRICVQIRGHGSYRSCWYL